MGKKMSKERKREIANRSFFTMSDVPGFKQIKGNMKRDAYRKQNRAAKAAAANKSV